MTSRGSGSEGIQYVLVTGAVADRVLAARVALSRERCASTINFDAQTRRLYYVKAHDGLAGPWVAVYRL